MKLNKKGFTHLEIALLLLVILAIGFAGYTVWQRQNDPQLSSVSDTNTSQEEQKIESKDEEASKAEAIKETTKDWEKVSSNASFTVKAPKSLLPSGSCLNGEVLLVITFNSDSFDYDCTGFQQAIEYASIAFGQHDKPVAPAFGDVTETKDVVLVDGNTATRSVVLGNRKGNGGDYKARYVVYDAVSKKDNTNYYAIYVTGVEFSDADKYLSDFDAVATYGWTIK